MSIQIKMSKLKFVGRRGGKTFKGVKHPDDYIKWLMNVNAGYNKMVTKFSRETILILDKQIARRFRVGGIEMGQTSKINFNWMPLSATTIQLRKAKGTWFGAGAKDNQPILQETGKLRKNIGLVRKIRKSGSQPKVRIVHGMRAGTPYGKKLHFGGIGKLKGKTFRIPPRPFIGLSPFIINKIRNFGFKLYIKNLKLGAKAPKSVKFAS